MKKILFCLTFSLFTFFAFSPVAYAQDIPLQYEDLCGDCNIDTIKNKVLSNSDVDTYIQTLSYNKYYIMFNTNIIYRNNIIVPTNAKYVFFYPNLDWKGTRFNYDATGEIQITFYGYFIFLDENYNTVLINNSAVNYFNFIHYLKYSNSNLFTNNLIYTNDFNLYMTNSYKDYNYIFYDNDKELLKIDYNYNLFDLMTDIQNIKYPPPAKYEINSIDYISHQIIGDDIPEEFNFLYLICDFLICVLFIFTVSSPFIIIIKLIRGGL